MLKVLVLHGPNLDLLGKRERNIYGDDTLLTINSEMRKMGEAHGLEMEFYQSNHEGDLVDKIGQTDAAGIIINPAAYTHTSVAISDALLAKSIPSVEVHLSNVYSREAFRHKSLIAPVVSGQISGFGKKSYFLGIEAIIELLKK